MTRPHGQGHIGQPLRLRLTRSANHLDN
uniref:Uncharacterized protein n=1 Tax=Arundo donax TaxID=35708 RepID=A0A0A9TS06_ARUDO